MQHAQRVSTYFSLSQTVHSIRTLLLRATHESCAVSAVVAALPAGLLGSHTGLIVPRHGGHRPHHQLDLLRRDLQHELPTLRPGGEAMPPDGLL